MKETLKRTLLLLASASFGLTGLASCDKENSGTAPDPTILQFVYTSDSHFGITRSSFRGGADVSSDIVNTALVAQINRLPEVALPQDGGVNAGTKVGAIEFVISSGDMANRAESGCLPAAQSWEQFQNVYGGLAVKNDRGETAPLYITPGNHDISNAIGHPKIPAQNMDATPLAGIYNYVYKPSAPKTAATYNYHTDKVNYSKTAKGVNLLFLTIWPDTQAREWMSSEMSRLAGPVLLFTHDEPALEGKHLTDYTSDPSVGQYVFTSKFENLVSDKAAQGASTSVSTDPQQKALTSFLKANPRIKAYFHGNTNYNEFYTYTGVPTGAISLPVFRVDSPMKGEHSASDEKLLSFQLVTIDVTNSRMTVRECLWNTTASAAAGIEWGVSRTIPIQ